LKIDNEIPQGTAPCHLEWDHDSRRQVLAALEVMHTYQNEVHESQQLMRCKSCGQLYFCDWQEVIRFFDHDGMQDYVLIPVANAAEAVALSLQSRLMRGGSPALVMVWPPEDARPYWIHR
jgi:hypothetical protein